MPKQQITIRERILDTALEQAEASSWEQLHLHSVAEALSLSLDEIRQHFPQKDDLVEAWFDRADKALLSASRPDNFTDLPLNERLEQVIASWLNALAPHRRLTREMLAYKLEPGHLHLQALGVMRVSRTVQWFREAAYHDSTGLQRIIDECALTTIYLASFARWMFDDSADSRKSSDFLKAALRQWQRTGSFGDRHSTESPGSEEVKQQPGH